MSPRLRSFKAPISYTIPEAAEAVGLSVTVIKTAIRSGVLPKHYPEKALNEPISTPVILAEDLTEWVRNSPSERVA